MAKKTLTCDEIEKRLDRHDEKIKEVCANQDQFQISQAEMLVKQNEIMVKLNKIHTALVGEEEYETDDNGGLVGKAKKNSARIDKTECEIEDLKTFKLRLTAIGATLSAVFTTAITLLGFYVKHKSTD